MGTRKVVVEVLARTDREGRIYPIAIKWEDGRKLRTDHITECSATAILC